MSISFVHAAVETVKTDHSTMDKAKQAAGNVGSFFGRIATNISNFWHTSVMPSVQKVINAAKGSFAKAQAWAQKHPGELKIGLGAAAAGVVITAVIMKFVCGSKEGDESKKKEDETKKA